PDLVGDVGGCDRAEERARGAGLHLEAEDGLAEELGDLLRLLRVSRLVLRALGVDLLQLRHARGRRVLRQLPGEQVVPRVAACDLDDVPPQPELLDVAEENDLHYAHLPRDPLARISSARNPLKAAASRPPPGLLTVATSADVGQKGHLARALHCRRDLDLVPAARAGDAP